MYDDAARYGDAYVDLDAGDTERLDGGDGGLIETTLGPPLLDEPPILSLSPHGLDGDLLWDWYDDLWAAVCMLRERYRLPVRTRWWEDAVISETLTALAVWVQRYDLGDWDDPPGKLALLFDLPRVHAVLRDGNDPFDPGRDRPLFDAHLRQCGVAAPDADADAH